jgi:PKD repeat protein
MSTRPEVVHTYEAFETYVISVAVKDVYDQTGFSSIELSLDLPLLDAMFTHETDSRDPMTIIFTGVGQAEAWNWEFGDGTKETGQVVTHTYNTIGEMDVTLTIADPYQQKEITQIVTISAPPLDIIFTHETDSRDPMTIIFTGVGQAETWNWEFGDGTKEAGQVVTHTYNTIGEMNVTLTIADPYQQKEITQIVTISAPSLDAIFTHETDSQDLVTHTYNATGEMTVTLTTTDAYQQKEITQLVTIFAPPIDVDFAVTLSDAHEPYTVSFFDRSYGPIATWQWYFGDGAASKEQNPVHTYGSAGEYTVQLIITSDYGETKVQQVRFIIPENVPDETLPNFSKLDIDLSGNETMITQTVVNQTVVKPVKQMAEVTEI